MPQRSAGSDFLHLDPHGVPRGGLTLWLVEALREGIADGRLVAGAALPSTRTLSADLGVSRGVVVEAYQRLHDEGLVSGQAGVGSQVTQRPPLSAPRAGTTRGAVAGTVATRPFLPLASGEQPPGVEIDLAPGVPDLSAFPRSAWLRAERAVLDTASTRDLSYGDPRGTQRLRHELAGWLGRTRGLRATEDDIIVVAGVAQSLALLAQTLVARGQTVIAVEDPGSRGARDEMAHWGMRPIPVPVDAAGLVVRTLARTSATATLLTPAHQFPTGVVLGPDRRRELLSWAAEGGLVIEDDYDAEHRYDRAPVPALQASAPQQVAHTGSTSKTLAPGMRLGWLVAPGQLRPELVAAKHASDLGCPAIPQLVLARLIANGDYDRHLRLVRARQRARRDAVLVALQRDLPSAQVQGVAAGLHLLVLLPELHGVIEDTELADRIRAAGVLVHPLSWHRFAPGPPGLVLGYAANPPERLSSAVERIASVVRGV